jgi:hypothetical protein
MKTYIVRGSKGRLYYFTWFIIALCDNAQKAKEIKERWLAELGMLKQKYTKEQCVEFEKQSEEDSSLWSTELNEWLEWNYRKSYPRYSDEVFIDEVNNNEIIYKL